MIFSARYLKITVAVNVLSIYFEYESRKTPFWKNLVYVFYNHQFNCFTFSFYVSEITCKLEFVSTPASGVLKNYCKLISFKMVLYEFQNFPHPLLLLLFTRVSCLEAYFLTEYTYTNWSRGNRGMNLVLKNKHSLQFMYCNNLRYRGSAKR